MRLYTGIIKWLCPFTNRFIWVFTKKKIYLLKTSSIGFYTIKTPHIYDCRSNLCKLFNRRHIFSRRLPHVSIEKTEFNLLCHILFIISFFELILLCPVLVLSRQLQLLWLQFFLYLFSYSFLWYHHFYYLLHIYWLRL